MLGAIYGDIAGSIYAFDNIKTTQFDLLSENTEFTDDSVLTIAVADWLLKGDHSHAALVTQLRYYAQQFPYIMGDYGTMFKQWIHQGGTEPYGSYGNGSAMRVAAVGWAFSTLEETEEMAKRSAEVTHNHREGIKGAQATAAAIFMARQGKSKEEIKQYISQHFDYNLSMSCDDIRPTYHFKSSCQGTVPPAIVAFLDSHDFESAIRLAISLGGDSDTLAAITGGIAEAFYGMQPSTPNGRNYTAEALAKLPTSLKEVVMSFQQVYMG